MADGPKTEVICMFGKFWTPLMLLDSGAPGSGGGGVGEEEIIGTEIDDEGDDDLINYFDESELEDEVIDDGAGNKGEKTFTQEEVNQIINKRFSEKRGYAPSEAEQTLAALKAAGIDPSAVLQQQSEKQLEDMADKLGMTTEAMTFVKGLVDKVQALEGNSVQQEVQKELDYMAKTYPDFETHKKDVIQIAMQKNLPLEDAYILATHPKKVESAKVAGEQAALAQVLARGQKKVNSTGETGGKSKPNIATMSSDKFEELKARVMKGDRIALS